MRDGAPSDNAIVAVLRGLLPDVRAALAYVRGLAHPPGPVVGAYLREHLGVWRLDWAMRTDAGPVRMHNEDGCFAWPDARAFMVLDGMGGQSSGEWATQWGYEGADRVLGQRALSAHDPPRDMQSTCMLFEAVLEAGAHIFHKVDSTPWLSGQCATAVAWMVDGTHANVVHVGDARAYRLRRGRLTPHTRDHSLIEAMIDAGRGTREDFKDSPYRNVITRALGASHDVEPGWSRHALRRSDVWLLCSDGLHRALSDAQIEASLNAHATESAQTRCDALVDAAIKAEASDNITAIVIEIG